MGNQHSKKKKMETEHQSSEQNMMPGQIYSPNFQENLHIPHDIANNGILYHGRH